MKKRLPLKGQTPHGLPKSGGTAGRNILQINSTEDRLACSAQKLDHFGGIPVDSLSDFLHNNTSIGITKTANC